MATERMVASGVELWATNNDYATAQGAASGIAEGFGYPVGGNNDYVGEAYDENNSPPFAIVRYGMLFDTSSISSFSSASLLLYVNEVYEASTFNIVVVSGADLESPIVGSDYGDLLNDVTSLGSISSAECAGGGWVEIPLNASAITAGGITKLALRSSRDISATTPKLNGEDSYRKLLRFSTVSGYGPKLSITETEAR